MVDKPILRMAPLPDTVKVCDGQNQFIKLPIPPHKPQHTVVLETVRFLGILKKFIYMN